MVTAHEPKLTAAEVAALWTQYMNEMASLCICSAMNEHIEDPEIRSIFEFALRLSVEHITKIKAFLSGDGFPIPTGFTEQDATLSAPRLFSDIFCLHYLNIMSLHGCHGYSGAVTTSSRKDIRMYFTECNARAVELCNRTKDVLLAKGLYFRPPAISPPKKTDFIDSDGFLSGFLHETRPLSCIEITNILFNLKKSIVAEGLAVSFAQVAESKKVKNFLYEAIRTKESHINMFKNILDEDHLPSPPTLVSEISDSTVSPFSDRLMMFSIGFLFSSAMVYYGSSLASTTRKDLAPKYLMAIGDDLRVGQDWIRIMIDNRWLEQPPLAEDRKALLS